ncbi:MAG: Aerobic glycerol-3-phosphate dehydrogenase [Afipia sp.]|jgi:glycerol-3-phosphate dehydrogenase|nr:MAG: Aerobic glycerol-3-phosphate dehydrogenase [Afipia sp.]
MITIGDHRGMADVDIAIIGGGLNGTSVARDAAGRGLQVALFEQNDLGSGGTAAAPHLMHGNFIDLERGNALRVRAALGERDIALRIAPHLVRPARFVLPVHSEERPPAMLRGGLFVYSRLAARSPLPRSEVLDLTIDEAGHSLKRSLGLALAYSDCTVDETRLVVLNAADAAARGAAIRTGARCVWAERSGTWRLAVVNRGRRETVTARALVNASGAWTRQVAETVLHLPAVQASFLKVSQIVVRRMFDGDNVYVLQNDDRRMVYAIPYHRDFTLIGTSERSFAGDPAMASASADDIAYLCAAASRYFRVRIEAADVVHAMAGCDATGHRNGIVKRDRKSGKAPLLTMIGGATTTARRRAEIALAQLASFFELPPSWTADEPLPGGDFSWDTFDDQVDNARQRWTFLSERHAQRLIASYGTRTERILGAAKSMDDLGPRFGDDLTGVEVRYLMTEEFARFADDIVWRRSKLGLTMSRQDREALEKFMAAA